MLANVSVVSAQLLTSCGLVAFAQGMPQPSALSLRPIQFALFSTDWRHLLLPSWLCRILMVGFPLFHLIIYFCPTAS